MLSRSRTYAARCAAPQGASVVRAVSRKGRALSRRGACGMPRTLVSAPCAAHCRAAGRWTRVVAEGSSIPTAVRHGAWTTVLDGAVYGNPRAIERDSTDRAKPAPFATEDFARSALRRSVAERAGARGDAAPRVGAEWQTSPRPVTARGESSTRPVGPCRVCGGMCAAALHPGRPCPRKGGRS